MLEKRVKDVRDTELQTSPSRALESSHFPVCEGTLSRDEMERRSLVASETRFRRLFEAARDGILLLDADTGEITDVNPFLEEILGRSREDFLQQKLWDIGLFEDVELCRHTFERLQQDKYVRYENLPLRHKSGERIEVEFVSNVYEVDGKKVIQCNIRDITERKRAATALLESEERFRVTFDQAAVGIAHVAPDGQLLRINQKFCDIVGYSPEELLAGKFQDITCPGDLEADRAHVRGVLAGEIQSYSMEKRYVRKDGSLVWINLTDALVRHSSGDPKYFISVVQDITERKHLEEQFLQAQKMQAIGRLAGGVAHDFNNLLTVITGYCEMLLNRLGDHDPIREQINEINTAGRRAATLTAQLLAFSRRQLVQPEVIHVNAVVADIEQLLHRLIGEDVRLITTFETGLWLVKVDRGQIGQVIMNLAINSRDAMPEGGTLTLHAANVSLDDEYARSHVGVQSGPYVMLSVSDTGCGMDAQTKARMFEPFFTTKEQGKGTGLGLSTVYGIVKQHNGHISVDSSQGKGSTVKIYLPRVAGAVQACAEPPAEVKRTRCAETVLLVEDDDQLRHLTSQILRGQGYTVLEADSGAEALLISERHLGPIQLMLSDIVMPEMNGYVLAELLRSSRLDTAVQFMSGYQGDVIWHQEPTPPDASIMTKPFTRERLLDKIREVLDTRENASHVNVMSASQGS
jgi:two-component system cell cycle sensor histidine kinase/response regulator CckA